MNHQLDSLVTGHNWVLVDAQYLQGSSGRPDLPGWQKFFSQLGVLDFLFVKRTTNDLSRDVFVSVLRHCFYGYICLSLFITFNLFDNRPDAWLLYARDLIITKFYRLRYCCDISYIIS